MTKQKQGWLSGFNETEEVGYCEELGEGAEALREGGKLAWEFSDKMVAAILDARTILNIRADLGSTHFSSIHLHADGLFYDDNFLGDFRAEGDTLIIWATGDITLRMNHKHNANAEISFDVEGF